MCVIFLYIRLVHTRRKNIHVNFVKVREMNLYKEGDMTPGNQLLTDFHLQQSWDELMTKIQYEDRVVAVEEFNKLVCTASCYSGV